MAAAASSPFTLSAPPWALVESRATGEITGRYPAFDNACRIWTLMLTGRPAKPRRALSIGSAAIKPPSSPEIPTAGSPVAMSMFTRRLLTRPDSTIRRSSRSPSDVTRRPPMKTGSLPSARCIEDNSSPPPWMTHSSGETRQASASIADSLGFACALPPIFTILIMPAIPIARSGQEASWRFEPLVPPRPSSDCRSPR